MSNLDKAKELLEQIIRYKKFPKLNPFISLLIEKATKIKEEVEEGCGNEIISYARVKGICGQTSRILKEVVSMYCQECQETLKILNKIIGEE